MLFIAVAEIKQPCWTQFTWLIVTSGLDEIWQILVHQPGGGG